MGRCNNKTFFGIHIRREHNESAGSGNNKSRLDNSDVGMTMKINGKIFIRKEFVINETSVI